MNTKIIVSLATILVVGAAAIGGTVAYFSDVETSTGNTFTAGTIDIAVDSENPWVSNGDYTFADMKPGQIEYSNFTIKNVGTNPVNLVKKVTLDTTLTEDEKENGINEPECAQYGGTWSGNACSGGTAVNNLEAVIKYDLSVKVYADDIATTPMWEQVLYKVNGTGTDATLLSLLGSDMALGMVPVGGRMDVVESYHMDAVAGNEYQSDKMKFDITLTGTQLTGTLVLEDKDSTDWRIKTESTPKVTVNYGVKDATFKIGSITGIVPLAGGEAYSLITLPESYSMPSGSGYPGNGIVLATVTTAAGTINGYTQVVTDPGTFTNMKVWLVPTANLATGTATLNSWAPANYLFDTGLTDYYKSTGI
jgi:predicted ribosomally synthesized peptide with SipW-like signal peptide